MAETTFIRTKKEKDYSTIDNTFLRDNTLSMQAKGLFAYILFLPEDWVIYQSELVKHFSNGRDAIAKAISELEENGYIEKQKTKNEKGQFSGCSFTIHEKPLRKTSNGKPVTVSPKSEIPTLPNTNNNQILNKPNTNELSNPFPEDPDEQKKCTKKITKKSSNKLKTESELNEFWSKYSPDTRDILDNISFKMYTLHNAIDKKFIRSNLFIKNESLKLFDFLVKNNRDVNEMYSVFEWASKDSFWSSKVIFMNMFLNNYEKLVINARNKPASEKHNYINQFETNKHMTEEY